MLDSFAPPRRSLVSRLVDSLDRERTTIFLLICSVLVSATYLATIFEPEYILGHGPFWDNPRGPWLMDSADIDESADILDAQIGYLGFLATPWHVPVFFVPNLGAPSGTNIIFLDSVPVAALLGKLASGLAGNQLNPYGVWVAACFVLSAVCAVLLVIELGQRSLLAAAAASVLALSAPTLLHRFGHLALMGHFVVIGALLLYFVDRRAALSWKLTARWAGWLSLAILVNLYLFVMAGCVYFASVLRREALTPGRVGPFVRERLTIVGVLVLVTVLAGHFGKGTGNGITTGSGFGIFSMNLASPFWPQRSGLFPDMAAIVDATGGQYEGFNYFGAGALLLIGAAVLLNLRRLRGHIIAHRHLFLVLAGLAAFAVSHRVFLGDIKLLDLDFSSRLDAAAGMFRSSGRMFWPVLYAAMLLGLVLVLRRLPAGPRAGFVAGCCLLQLADTEPLRDRLAMLTRRDVPHLLDQAAWRTRMLRAAGVRVDPPALCSGSSNFAIANMELQSLAMATHRPINSVYNPRLRIDCAAEAAVARSGPWRDDTLYVLLAGGPTGVPPGWSPPLLSCKTFRLGIWCLGPKGAP